MDQRGERRVFAIVLAIIAILLGLITIVKLAAIVEFAVAAISLTFGVMAIIWTYRARRSLSKGSELRRYTTYFMLSLVSILLFSIWDTTLGVLGFQVSKAGVFVYPKFFFITIAYFIFLKASYEILYLSKSFGFEMEASKIKKLVKKKQKKKS